MDIDTNAITPALKALIDASDGVAEIVDKETGRVFVVGEKDTSAPSHDGVSESYVQERLDEARADLREGRSTNDLPTEDLLAEARQRHRLASEPAP